MYFFLIQKSAGGHQLIRGKLFQICTVVPFQLFLARGTVSAGIKVFQDGHGFRVSAFFKMKSGQGQGGVFPEVIRGLQVLKKITEVSDIKIFSHGFF